MRDCVCVCVCLFVCVCVCQRDAGPDARHHHVGTDLPARVLPQGLEQGPGHGVHARGADDAAHGPGVLSAVMMRGGAFSLQ